MNGFVGVTYNDWFAFLSQQPGIDEVDFWQSGGGLARVGQIGWAKRSEQTFTARVIRGIIERLSRKQEGQRPLKKGMMDAGMW